MIFLINNSKTFKKPQNSSKIQRNNSLKSGNNKWSILDIQQWDWNFFLKKKANAGARKYNGWAEKCNRSHQQ